MAIIHIESNNSKLSYILFKNPNTGMQIKTLRKGYLHGWYTDDNNYVLYFKDSFDEISYPHSENQEFEYLTLTKYNSCQVYMNMISTLLKSTTKVQHEYDTDNYHHTLEVSSVNLNNLKIFNSFNKSLNGIINIELLHLQHNTYKIKFSSNRSLFFLLNYCEIFFLMNAVKNNEHLYVNDDVLNRFMQVIDKLEPPYFIMYHFKVIFLLNHNKFNKYRHLLEKSSSGKVSIQNGTNLQQRMNFIKCNLSYDRSILDIGCGEGNYLKFSNHIENYTYYGVDTDEKCLAKSTKKILDKKYNNVKLFESLSRFYSEVKNEEVDIIITEVIEHIELVEVENFVHYIIDNIKFSTIILTTPNKDFNVYYNMRDDEIRHDDHKWELNYDQLKKFMNSILSKYTNIEVKYSNIGDSVNDTYTTLSIIIKKK